MNYLKKKVFSKFLGSVFLSGPIGFFVSFFARKFLGALIDAAIIQVDFLIIERTIKKQVEDYREFIKEIDGVVKLKDYTELEKEDFRRKYLDALKPLALMNIFKKEKKR